MYLIHNCTIYLVSNVHHLIHFLFHWNFCLLRTISLTLRTITPQGGKLYANVYLHLKLHHFARQYFFSNSLPYDERRIIGK